MIKKKRYSKKIKKNVTEANYNRREGKKGNDGAKRKGYNPKTCRSLRNACHTPKKENG